MTLCTRTTPEPGCAHHIPARLAPERSPGVVVLPGPTLDDGLAALIADEAGGGS
jgi:hypothetical protein